MPSPFIHCLRGWREVNASVPLIKLSSAEGTVLFLQFIFLKMAGWDYLFQKMKCFSLFITLCLILLTKSDWWKMCSLITSLKALHISTELLFASDHKSVLSVDTADEEHCEWGWIELIALSSISKIICQSENIKDVESILV